MTSFQPFFQAHIQKFRTGPNGQATGLCPLHEDHNPSFSCNIEAGVWKCHSCDKSGNVIQLADLLGVPPPVNGNEKIFREISRYTYEAESGQSYMQVRRYFPKMFRQFRFENGEWKAGLNGIKPVLYRLPEIIKANVVFVTEGEKDVETLRKWELKATTNAGGAGKWRDEYSEVLREKIVVILPDNDKLGGAHTSQVAKSLWGKAKSIKIVRLPKGKDVSDWVASGGTFETLLDMVEKATPLGEADVRVLETPQIKISDEPTWEEAILFGEIQVPEIPASMLPSWLGDFVESVSRATQTPTGLAVMMGLATVATCLQKRFEVCPFGDLYTEPLNLWTVTALPPASRKTAVASLLTEPLNEWEREQTIKLQSQIDEIETTRDVNLKRIEKLQSQAATSENSQERARLIQEINQLKQDIPEELRAPRLWTGDVTPERLQNLLVEHGERMAVLSDEGGIFEILAGLYSNGKANIDVFLQSHAGKGVRVDRGGRTAHLNKPALSFGLAVQPEIVSELSQGNKRHFRGNGMLARFLYCIPKSNIGQRNAAQRIIIPNDVQSRFRAEIHTLLDFPPLKDEAGMERPKILTLSKEALDAWLAFSQYIESNQGEEKEFEPIQDWTGKLPGAALRIAGNCHIVEYGGNNLTISKGIMERALDLCELLICHAQVAFELMGHDIAYDDARKVFSWVLKNREASFRQNDCLKALHGRFRKVERLLKAFSILKDHNIISGPERLPTKKPTTIYQVNPAIFKGGANGVA